jgi:hypothetical protein
LEDRALGHADGDPHAVCVSASDHLLVPLTSRREEVRPDGTEQQADEREGGDSRQQDAREQGGIQDCEVSRRIRAVTDPQAGSVMVWPGASWPRAILGN